MKYRYNLKINIPKIKSGLIVIVLLLFFISHIKNGFSLSPDTPTNPHPVDGATEVGSIFIEPILSVDVSDGDGDSMDVSFYNGANDALIGKDYGVPSGGRASVEWWPLSAGTTYSWYAVADDGTSTTTSPTWSFTTNYAPDIPSNPSPSDNSTRIIINPILSVEVSDVDSNNLEVYFYNASDNNVIGWDYEIYGGLASIIWPGLSYGTTYSWYAMVTDEALMTFSPIWNFTTDFIPELSSDPYPLNDATGLETNPILSINVSDLDGDSMDVYFYNESDDSLIGIDYDVPSGGTASTIWTGLSYDSTYNWYVKVDDNIANLTSPIWSFTTNFIPNQPSSPYPANGASGISLNPVLSAGVSDTDGDLLDVYFYNASDDSLIGIDYNVSSGGRASFLWSGLLEGTSYSWYITSFDGMTYKNSSIWSFETSFVNPEIEILTPYPNEVFGNNAPQFSIEIYEPNLNSTWYTIDNGKTNFTCTENGIINQLAWDLISSGNVTISFYANDSFGCIGFKEIQVEKDIDPPYISIIDPVEGEIFESSPSYYINVSDSNLDKIWYTLNMELTKYYVTTLTGGIDLSLWNSLLDGNITIRFYVNDSASNINFDEVIVIKKVPLGIYGYDLFLVLGIISMVSIIIIRKRLKS